MRNGKKPNWFKRMVASWVRDLNEEKRIGSDSVELVESDSPNARISVRFTLYPASGGWVIEHNKQDRYKDCDGPSLTIVNHGEELGKAVEHIISMEALKS